MPSQRTNPPSKPGQLIRRRRISTEYYYAADATGEENEDSGEDYSDEGEENIKTISLIQPSAAQPFINRAIPLSDASNQRVAPQLSQPSLLHEILGWLVILGIVVFVLKNKNANANILRIGDWIRDVVWRMVERAGAVFNGLTSV